MFLELEMSPNTSQHWRHLRLSEASAWSLSYLRVSIWGWKIGEGTKLKEWTSPLQISTPKFWAKGRNLHRFVTCTYVKHQQRFDVQDTDKRRYFILVCHNLTWRKLFENRTRKDVQRVFAMKPACASCIFDLSCQWGIQDMHGTHWDIKITKRKE